MEEIVIDTNFLLTCVKQKIDLFSELERIFGVYLVIVPEQVFWELGKLQTDKELKLIEREAAALSLIILKKLKIKPKRIRGRNADDSIVNYANENNIVLASLDREVKKRIKNSSTKFLTIRNKKRIEPL